MYLVKIATSLSCHALVAYLVHILWLIFTAKRSRNLIGPGYTMLGLSLVASTEIQIEDMEGAADMNVLSNRLASLEVIPLEKLVCRKYLMSS